MIKDLVPEGYLVKPSTPADILGTISLVLPSYTKKDFAKVQIAPFVDSNGLSRTIILRFVSSGYDPVYKDRIFHCFCVYHSKYEHHIL